MARTLRFADQAEVLEEGDQVLSCEHQLQPDPVGIELLKGEAPQPAVTFVMRRLREQGTT